MTNAEYRRTADIQLTSAEPAFSAQVIGSELLTTRDAVTDGVAAGWLEAHPEVKVTQADLSKTLQQLFTELLETGGQRQRRELSAHAQSLLGVIGVDAAGFAPARTYSKKADLPVEYGVMFGRLAAVLAPLAAAIQLTRIPVTNAAAALLAADGSAQRIERRQLRGFVVANLRPHAQRVHARVGAAESADVYVRLILNDRDELAAAVVAAAEAKCARPDELNDFGRQRLEACVREHLPQLRRTAVARYGQHADDIVSAALAKLAAAFRNNPTLSVNEGYALVVLRHSADTFFSELGQQHSNETSGYEEIERIGSSSDDTAAVELEDLVVQSVLAAAGALTERGVRVGTERALARQALLRYFLHDPTEMDPRRARLAEHVLSLTPSGGEHDDVSSEVGVIAATLTATPVAAERITSLAITALRAQIDADGERGPRQKPEEENGRSRGGCRLPRVVAPARAADAA